MKFYLIYQIMKKLILFVALLLGVNALNAQINKGNVMLGGDLANLNVSFDNQTTFNLTPKAAWFIDDGVALGSYMHFGVTHINGESGSNYSYGIGPLARYFFSIDQLPALKKTKFFVEANAGFEGVHSSVNSSNTNGMGFGFGPGVSYFITPSVGVEALLKYDGILGFGSTTYTNGLSFGIGLQVYLPCKKLAKEVKSF